MRLTLRNLLAYMDGLLDPESTRIIGKKIEESGFASGLLHRIRDVTRRSKLTAPEVIDQKDSLDPNTVAEYLDNTLASDRVTDFEKVCLESDAQLAEVAASHQVLSLVLGEPAEVNPESRVRMYNLPETVSSQTYVETADVPPVAGNTPPAVPAVQPSPPRPTVPDYLREARRRRKRIYWIATAAVVLLVGYLGLSGQLAGLLGGGDNPTDSSQQLALNLPPKSASPDGPAPAEPLEESAGPRPPEIPDPTETVEVPDPGGLPAAVDASMPGPESIVPVTPIPVAVPGSPGAVPEMPDPLIPAVQPPVIEPMVPAAPPESREIARLFTAEEMAVAVEAQGEPFLRVANSDSLHVGHRVVSLPTARPVIGVDGRLHVEMVDGGELQFLPSEVDGVLNLQFTSGRMILQTTAQAGTVTVGLHTDRLLGELTLADPTTLVAIDVDRKDGLIEDPETQPATPLVRLWGVSGNFTWKATGDPIGTPLESPVAVDLMAPAAEAIAETEPPAWVKTDLTSKLDRRAAILLNLTIQFERPVDLSLRELVDHRQRETRQLTRQFLGWIEDFDPIVAVLNDEERYSEWPEVIDLLRDSIRRGPRTALAVREAMKSVYGLRGKEFYDLLWRYDVEELSRRQAEVLVDYLADESLPGRVLSFRNLNRITGAGYYYRPEESEAKRRSTLQRWNNWAEKQPEAEPGAS